MIRKRKFKKVYPKNPQEDIDLNVYVYNSKVGKDGKLEWASVGVIEKVEYLDGVQIG